MEWWSAKDYFASHTQFARVAPMLQSDGARERDVAVLEPLGRGVQSDVFGTEDWVVKVPRLSFLGVLAKWVSSKRWLGEVRGSLGGLVAPFFILEEIEFRAPKMSGRGRIGNFKVRTAIARERYAVDSFLDHQLSLVGPAEGLALVESMVVLVERVRARGFFMHDFIMRNFVLVDGRLMIADMGLITPMRAFWEPATRICAWGFLRGLTKDYQRLLGELRDEVEGDEALRDRIEAFSEALPARLGRLCKRDLPGLEVEAAVPVELDAGLEKVIRAALQSVR